MKKSAIITIIIAILVLAGGLIYYKFSKPSVTFEYGKLIPDDATVYAGADQLNALKSDSGSVSKWIKSVPYVDSLLKDIFHRKFLKEQKKYLVSIHRTGKNTSEQIIYIDNPTLTIEEMLGNSLSNRKYKNMTIYSSDWGHALDLNNIKVYSPSSFLIESVCKTITENSSLEYRNNKIYVNWKNLDIVAGPESGFSTLFSNLGSSYIEFNNNENQGVQFFSGQSSSADSINPINWKDIVQMTPMNTIALKTNSGTATNSLPEPERSLITGNNYSQLILKEDNEMVSIYLTPQVQIKTGKFYKIQKNEVQGFEFTHLFYATEQDSAQCSVLNFGKYYIISRDEKAIFNLLLQIQDENVWGKSLYYHELLSNLSTASAHNLIINPTFLSDYNFNNGSIKSDFLAFQVMALKDKGLISGWVNVMENSSGLIAQQGTIASSNSSQPTENLDNNTNSNMAINRNYKTIVRASQPIISKTYLMRNHKLGTRELLFQTENHKINLYSLDGKKLWNKKINDSIISEIYQIDRYKNNKLQYLFATKNKIHLIDRLGRDVEGFPIKVSSIEDIEHFSYFDYDRKKEYRLCVVDKTGKTLILNIEGKKLGVWSPFKFDGALLAPIQHVKVQNKDCFVAVSKNGMVHLLKRNGSYYPGFPKQTGKNAKAMHVDLSKSFEKSQVCLLSENKLIKVSFMGKTINTDKTKKQKDGFDIMFSYQPANYFVLSSTSGNKLYNKNLDEVGFLNLSGDSIRSNQLYHFDNSPDILLLHTGNGNLQVSTVNGRSLSKIEANKQPVSLLNQEAKRQLLIYYSNKNEVQKITVPY